MTPSNPVDPVTRNVTARLSAMLDADPSPARLRAALRLLGKWRSHVLASHVQRRGGERVQRGPFAGMIYGLGQSEGAYIPRLLGIYEHSLTPVIEGIIAGDYTAVLDVGSAEGYYAVGLALRMPRATIHAYEIDPKARALLEKLAAQNDVTGRIRIHPACTHASFDLCRSARSVVICDIEGAEEGLLDPARAPGLEAADILVETHPGMAIGVTDRLKERFAATHHVTTLGRALDSAALPDWMEELDDMDRMIALWEWRASPTPWLWMTRK